MTKTRKKTNRANTLIKSAKDALAYAKGDKSKATLTRMKPTLPDKMSDLILLALDDLAKVEKDKRYHVDMWTFHEKNGDKCDVCFAGSVMAMTLGKKINHRAFPDSFPEDTRWKLVALDELRMGNVGNAADLMDISHYQKYCARYFSTEIAKYETDKSAFKRDMKKLAKDLAKAGF